MYHSFFIHSCVDGHLGCCHVLVAVQSVAQSCLTLCDTMDCSQSASLSIINSQSLLKLTSIELVMPSNYLILCHPLHLLPSVFPRIMVFSNELDWFPLGWTDFISLQSKGLSRVFSSITIQRHQFFGTQPCLLPSSHIHTWLLEKIIALPMWNLLAK